MEIGKDDLTKAISDWKAVLGTDIENNNKHISIKVSKR